MCNKYCKKLHPFITRNIGAFRVWRKIQEVREEVEYEIWWQLKAGNSSFWFDKWTRVGALYHVEGWEEREEEMKYRILFLMMNKMW